MCFVARQHVTTAAGWWVLVGWVVERGSLRVLGKIDRRVSMSENLLEGRHVIPRPGQELPHPSCFKVQDRSVAVSLAISLIIVSIMLLLMLRTTAWLQCLPKQRSNLLAGLACLAMCCYSRGRRSFLQPVSVDPTSLMTGHASACEVPIHLVATC